MKVSLKEKLKLNEVNISPFVDADNLDAQAWDKKYQEAEDDLAKGVVVREYTEANKYIANDAWGTVAKVAEEYKSLNPVRNAVLDFINHLKVNLTASDIAGVNNALYEGKIKERDLRGNSNTADILYNKSLYGRSSEDIEYIITQYTGVKNNILEPLKRIAEKVNDAYQRGDLASPKITLKDQSNVIDTSKPIELKDIKKNIFYREGKVRPTQNIRNSIDQYNLMLQNIQNEFVYDDDDEGEEEQRRIRNDYKNASESDVRKGLRDIARVAKNRNMNVQEIVADAIQN